MFRVEFYGTLAAYPDGIRGYSCIGIRQKEEEGLTLLDCGDGAVHNLTKFGANLLSIQSIVITHYHSDHISGLASIVETMGILKRTEDLRIFGPKGIEEYFDTIQRITNVAAHRKFEIKLTELRAHDKFKSGTLELRAFPLQHSINCFGYRIEEAGGGEKKVVSYTGDTEPCSESIRLARDADLLIHEATFLEDNVANARLSRHSTAREAAQTARKANAKKLMLTHTSFYNSTRETLMEAKEVFSNVQIAHDGLSVPWGRL
jgi:ribonuclease Z